MMLDRTQVSTFIDSLVGFRTVGVAGYTEVKMPCSPEARNFVAARLGNLMAGSCWEMLRKQTKRDAMVAFLREVADSLEGLRG